MKQAGAIAVSGLIGIIIAEGTPTSNAEEPRSTNSEHWAFRAPRRPAVPKVLSPDWVRTPIDAFVLARLERESLEASPEADRATLIRRLSLDLTGLPPTLAEIESFLKDRRPEAYEETVDRLLGSPRFGERWGRHWLDLARYADSDGYEKDSVRPYAYLYRDWVINAINRDLPFDRFTIEQLAGDLLPEATDNQRIATGFHRQTLTNKEGGVDQEEFRCKATVDRVNTTSTVWLGLTVGCAECHSHKYDPISQREFYQLYAFFNNASETDIPAPQLAELAVYQEGKRRWQEENSRLTGQWAAYVKSELPGKQAQWEQTFARSQTDWVVLQPRRVVSAEGATLKVQADHSVVASDKSPAKDTYIVVTGAELHGITGFRLEILDDRWDGRGPGRGKNHNFVLSEFVVKVGQASSLSRNRHDSGDPHLAESADAEEFGTGWKPVLQVVPLQNASADHAPNDWPVAGAADGDPKTGWAIDPQFDQRHVAVFETKEDLELRPGQQLIFELRQQYGTEHTIARFRLSATTTRRPLQAHLTPDSINKLLSVPPEQRRGQEKEEVFNYYRDEWDPGALKFRRQLADHAKREPKFPDTKAAVLAENEAARPTHIHIRGDFLRKGEEVQPGTPAVLHAFTPRAKVGQASSLSRAAAASGVVDHKSRSIPDEAEPSGTGEAPVLRPDRLDLAYWLMDPANPLTARISVNHVWKHLFGRGLVSTVEDFGTRGDKPTHPELLDWLATEFPKLGWSRKALIRLIVTSSTYRQSSRLRPELLERDPSNSLLARQGRFRLEAESVRDAYLSVGGLLNPLMGGPSVRPPLPADIAAIGYANQIKWKESEGPDRYRRGLYTFFQRTVPYPMLMTFDAPDSNVTCARRERSNTPLQALTLLNDPVFFESAQALGRRLTESEPADRSGKVRLAFKMCLSREATAEEAARLEQLYEHQRRSLGESAEHAAQVAGVRHEPGRDWKDRAALTMVARTLMNLDEFVTRE